MFNETKRFNMNHTINNKGTYRKSDLVMVQILLANFSFWNIVEIKFKLTFCFDSSKNNMLCDFWLNLLHNGTATIQFITDRITQY